MAQELGGQRRGGRLGDAAADRDLAAGVPGLGAQVAPVQGLERLGRQEPQPEEQRHRRRLAELLRQGAGDLQVGVLDDVGGTDPPLEPAIQAEHDHPPQPVQVPGQHRASGRTVAPRGRLPAGALPLVIGSCHVDRPHIPETASRPPFGTRPRHFLGDREESEAQRDYPDR